MDSSTARHWMNTMASNAASVAACGCQNPYKAAKRAVVSGSFTGVQSRTHG